MESLSAILNSSVISTAIVVGATVWMIKLFSGELKNLINRIRSAKGFGGEVGFDPRIEQVVKAGTKGMSQSASAYWLGLCVSMSFWQSLKELDKGGDFKAIAVLLQGGGEYAKVLGLALYQEKLKGLADAAIALPQKAGQEYAIAASQYLVTLGGLQTDIGHWIQQMEQSK